ncbi:cupin domain-containing protein [Thermotoga sp. KOL6]|uniref:cupin domain-containing protein n=1 Tax=Thermotoga sp. KOL6 TaxID=126741 RepID=UPI000C764825|nr:cupin domain-containing protein [Thermotoga sp. KOL6]PLV59994.1 cupin [Thermotoga sp. KOL6]
MVVKSSKITFEKVLNMRGGKGEVEMAHLLSQETMRNKLRLFALMKLPPNSSVGLHKHEGEFEIYYILSGEGVFHDNGKDVPVKAGDVCFTDSGESHSIENTGDKNLEFLAMIVLL